ncbi:hypothetical protein ONS95_000207 [Cadophora gregata]|uniref:uncharacterized protein n=1 Tax=Cadophora gregata TaxID=51156 RepID=UPI0026DB3487|nr:uncharacterized protein ONS95_000207 [Cadophora gregata]KAK0115516.1 hypothetical protein ONS96_013969 [Cadophora gregata f. sp. sojae]KAK0128229.1 hypothetical protein ONS95_000207 [Cadophora gregata]
MDPFSIVVGAVALTEAANKLAGTLTDRYQAFRSAPKQLIEIAGQVTLCAGLVDVFAKSVDSAGQSFPRKFEQDAAALVMQCRVILKEIDEMIPPGSKKPDYQQRLKYAFCDEKKIVKQQDRLKQVQHMFMFMTTCWMYQLPSPQTGPPLHSGQAPRQPTSLTASTTPSGSLQSATSQNPMQFSMKGFGGIYGNEDYEAILTLTLIRQPLDISRPLKTEREKVSQGRERITISDTQKDSLENMRRSPYFSLGLLRPPVETERYSRTAEDAALRMQEEKIRIVKEQVEEEKRRLEMYRMEERSKIEMKGDSKSSKDSERKDKLEEKERDEERRDFEPISKKQAERDVGNIISGWFSDNNEESYSYSMSRYPPSKKAYPVQDEYRPTSNYSQSPHPNPIAPIIKETSYPRPSPSNAPKPVSSTSTSPLPQVRVVDDWDWRCDGCDKKFYYHDLRYKCQDCSNFDFCPSCFPNVWHQHPTSSFVERSV